MDYDFENLEKEYDEIQAFLAKPDAYADPLRNGDHSFRARGKRKLKLRHRHQGHGPYPRRARGQDRL